MDSKPTCLTTATTQVSMHSYHSSTDVQQPALCSCPNSLIKQTFGSWNLNCQFKPASCSLASWQEDAFMMKLDIQKTIPEWHTGLWRSVLAKREQLGSPTKGLPAHSTSRMKSMLTTWAKKDRMLLKSHNKKQSSHPTDITGTSKERVDLLLPKCIRPFKQRLCTYLGPHL